MVLAEFTMAAFITAVTDWFTAAVGWVQTVASTIGGTPILLAFCSLPIPRPWALASDCSSV